MAPPSAPEGYWKRPKVADPALCTNVPGLADNLNGIQSAAKIDLTIGRSDAAYYLWKVAVSSEKGRNEVAKAGCTQRLLDLMVSGSSDAKFHAVGCLQSLIALDETRDAVASGARYIACLGDLLLGKTHDRIQPVAADILHTICLNPELSPRVAPVIPQLVELCRRREAGERIAGARQLDGMIRLRVAGITHAELSEMVVEPFGGIHSAFWPQADMRDLVARHVTGIAF